MFVLICSAKVKKSDEDRDIIFNYLCSPLLKTRCGVRPLRVKSLDMDKKTLEKYSSAFTLSDMEIFIFPDLLYALVLANIMSPEIWKWRSDPWFTGITKMGTLKKIHRVKQYVMDHYNFNLDLETWGLTDKQTEINRFSDFVDFDMLSSSNALFGYEGDVILVAFIPKEGVGT